MEKIQPKPEPVKYHTVHPELLDHHLKTSITLVGAGGTGSHMLDGLARMDRTLRQLGHQGLSVIVFDQDVVEAHNVGRQRFGYADIAENKAQALIRRVNRMYDLDWSASGSRFDPPEATAGYHHNIVITTVDDNRTRNIMHERFRAGFGIHRLKTITEDEQEHAMFLRTHYWMDIGNGKDFGQIVLGAHDLPDAVEVNCAHLPGRKYDEAETNEPSCSAVESLRMQDLFINQIMAAHALDMLWNLFRKGVIWKPVLYVNIAQDRYAVKGTFKSMPHVNTKQKRLHKQKRVSARARSGRSTGGPRQVAQDQRRAQGQV